MSKFAVFFVPEQQDEFYRLGTGILGYDVRNPAVSPDLPPPLTHGLFDERWVQSARPFGFHLTIGDAMEAEPAAIEQAAKRLAEFSRCFQPGTAFTLQRHAPVTIWGTTIVLPFVANEALVMLHTLVVAGMNTLGLSSGYLRRLQAGTLPEANNPAQAQKTRLFFSPFVLDTWVPHFTVLNPYTGMDITAVARELGNLFNTFQGVDVNSVCLMVQEGEGFWRIYDEYRIP